MPAALHHQVNPHVLRAILRVESGLNPRAINRNKNGTLDVGIGQMNSMHFPALAQQGIAPVHLLDECVGTYVAAWHLAGILRKHGNHWDGIARYHSSTPYFNYRYQILLSNELVRAGVIEGRIRPVPPLNPGAPNIASKASAAGPAGTNASSAVAFDTPAATATN